MRILFSRGNPLFGDVVAAAILGTSFLLCALATTLEEDLSFGLFIAAIGAVLSGIAFLFAIVVILIKLYTASRPPRPGRGKIPENVSTPQDLRGRFSFSLAILLR